MVKEKVTVKGTDAGAELAAIEITAVFSFSKDASNAYPEHKKREVENDLFEVLRRHFHWSRITLKK